MKLDIHDIKTTEVFWKWRTFISFSRFIGLFTKVKNFLNYKNIDWVSHEVNLIKGDQ